MELVQGGPAFVMADPFHIDVQEAQDYCAEGSLESIPEPLFNKQVT